MRVVSLIASSTEIVHALGQGGSLVGRSHECDHPASVLALPVLTEAKINASASSRAIDEQVKGLLKEAVSIYRLDGERLNGRGACDAKGILAAQLVAAERARGAMGNGRARRRTEGSVGRRGL